MSSWLALGAMIATLDPLRVHPGLPGSCRRDRLELAALGAALVFGLLVLAAALSGPLLDAVEISAPTARIAAGVAVALLGGRDAVTGPVAAEPALAGRRAAVVPVAVPHLFQPGLTLLTVSAATDLGVVRASGLVLVGLVLVVALGAVDPPDGAGARLERAGQALTGGVALALGAALVLNGVLDI